MSVAVVFSGPFVLNHTGFVTPNIPIALSVIGCVTSGAATRNSLYSQPCAVRCVPPAR